MTVIEVSSEYLPEEAKGECRPRLAPASCPCSHEHCSEAEVADESSGPIVMPAVAALAHPHGGCMLALPLDARPGLLSLSSVLCVQAWCSIWMVSLPLICKPHAFSLRLLV
jgi:hypothetical protein